MKQSPAHRSSSNAPAAQPLAPAPDTVAAALRFADLDPVDARILLQHALGASHAQLIAHPERALADPERHRFLALAERRRAGEPIAYIIGRREFYGRTFEVDPSVLIPRPETELLVDLALERMPGTKPCRVLDLGTGSGSIAITLALERPRSTVYGVDASPDALRVARANAKNLAAANVHLVEGTWYAPVAGMTFDLIVSNPPYVAEDDPHLAQGDVRFEPRAALAAGPRGLDAIGTIVTHARTCLRPGGWLLLEHGYDQAEPVAELLHRAGFVDGLVARDLAQLPRVSGSRISAREPSSA